MTEGDSFGDTVRSILARASKSQSHVGDFYIELEDPHRRYHPGDHVRGAVKIDVTKSARITHLAIQLHGAVRVYKSNQALSKEPSKPAASRDGASLKETPGHHKICDLEKVLCGEGMLHENSYSIQFSLRLPTSGIPSSLKFERGYIDYTLEAILTKPKKVNPVMSASRRIQVAETIDVAWMPVPDPQSLYLPHSHTRSITRPSLRPTGSASKIDATKPTRPGYRTEPGSTEGSSNTTATRSRSGRTSAEELEVTQKSIPLDTNDILPVDEPSEPTSGFTADLPAAERISTSAHSTPTRRTTQPVCATVELARIGYLAGDLITATITIKHNKPIWSMHGIIMTFARYGHTSLYPDRREPSDDEDDDVDETDRSPAGNSSSRSRRSRQRLAKGIDRFKKGRRGKSASFQKNLSQTFAPLIVDPQNLSAVLKASVKIPSGCFSTIAHGTGDLVAIRYFVEVIVDLGGKLASQSKYLPSLSNVRDPVLRGPDGQTGELHEDVAKTTISTSGIDIIETNLLRRERNVVSFRFEVIVGTRDSSRSGKAVSQQQQQDQPTSTHPLTSAPAPTSAPSDELDANSRPPTNPRSPLDLTPEYSEGPNPFFTSHSTYVSSATPAAPPLLPSEPTPHTLEQAFAQQPDEKSRVRLAEQLLLPSAPPPPSSSSAEVSAETLSTGADASGARSGPELGILTDLRRIEEKMGIERERSGELPEAQDGARRALGGGAGAEGDTSPRPELELRTGSGGESSRSPDGDGVGVADVDVGADADADGAAFADAVPSLRVDLLPRYER